MKKSKIVLIAVIIANIFIVACALALSVYIYNDITASASRCNNCNEIIDGECYFGGNIVHCLDCEPLIVISGRAQTTTRYFRGYGLLYSTALMWIGLILLVNVIFMNLIKKYNNKESRS